MSDFYYRKNGYIYINVKCNSRKQASELIYWCRNNIEHKWQYRGSLPLPYPKAKLIPKEKYMRVGMWEGECMLMIGFKKASDASIFSLFWV